MTWRRIVFVLILIFSITVPTPASASEWIQFESSPSDTYNRPDLSLAYDITQVDFGITDTDSGNYRFFLDFAQPISASQFADGNKSWAGIFLDLDGDGKEEYSLETSADKYVGTEFHDGLFADITSGSAVYSTKCKVRTFSSIDTGASWIGFIIPKNCLPFGNSVGIQGYSDHVANDSADFDYAPTKYWTVTLSGSGSGSTGGTGATGSSSSSVPSSQLPSVNSVGFSSPTNPAFAAFPPDRRCTCRTINPG